MSEIHTHQANRLARLYQTLDNRGFDAFLATRRPNQLYFTPAQEPVSDIPPVAYMLYTPQQTIVIPGPLFFYAARDGLSHCEIVETKVGGIDAITALANTCQTLNLKRIVCDAIEPGAATALDNRLPALELVQDTRFGPALRRTKDEGELKLLREAARISDQGMLAAFTAARPGVSTREIAAAATETMLAAGCEEVGVQVAAGPGIAYMGTGSWVSHPRHTLQPGDMLLVDMGILYHGYLGDQTRTAIIGEPSPRQRELIETIQLAYRQTRDAMRPGVSSQELYAITVDLLAQKGWRDYFPHHISHGLGLGEDLPRVADGSEDILQAGDTLSCEPGVYIPGVGGARFENMLYIDDQGAHELTQSPVDPVTGV